MGKSWHTWTLIVLAALCVALGVGLFWLGRWDGSRSYTELRAGERFVLDNGVGIVVPEAGEAQDTLNWDIPVWVPFSDNRNSEMREILNVRGVDDTDGTVAVIVYFDELTPPGLSDARVVATASGTTVYDLGDDSDMAVIEVGGPAHPAYIMYEPDSTDAIASARRIWDLLDIDGATRP